MNCTKCGGITCVINTARDADGVYRQRKCLECGHVMYSEEKEADISKKIWAIQAEQRRQAKAYKERR